MIIQRLYDTYSEKNEKQLIDILTLHEMRIIVSRFPTLFMKCSLLTPDKATSNR